MKRQIFWLLFSCITASTFISNSMEEGDTPYEEPTEVTSIYPGLPAQNKQGWLEYICEDLKLISRKKLKKYLGGQVAGLMDTIRDEGNFEEFFQDAAKDLYEAIDKKEIKKLCLKLQANYLPYMVDESIEDTRLHLVVLMILEKAIEYAENASDNAKEGEDTIWNDEDTVSFLEWVSPILSTWSHTAINKYRELYPALELDETSEATTKTKALVTKNSPETHKVNGDHIKALQRRIKALEKKLVNAEKAQPRSTGIMLVNGAILGWGSYFVLSMLSRSTCDYLPCVAHFEPNSMSGSLFYAMLGTIATAGSLCYLQSAKNLRFLLTKIITQSGEAAGNAYLKIEEIRERLKKKSIKKQTPWMAFEKSLTDVQVKLIPEFADLIEGVFKGKADKIKEFLSFYDEYLTFMKHPKRASAQKFKNFCKFVTSLNEQQKSLLNKAVAYLRDQVSDEGEKED